MNASIALDHSPTRDPRRHRVRALLRIEGTVTENGSRVPLNLAVVLDRSGSMNGAKLAHARDAASQLLSQVFPDDTTSVVVFDHEVEVVAGAARRDAQAALSHRIDRIEAGGSTNLSGGWMEGRSQVDRFRDAERSNRILLLTDGRANHGVTDPAVLRRLFAEAREQGVTTSTIGFGEDFDENLLRELADAGGGNTHYIEDPDQAPDVFRNELDELLSLSAQNVRAEVRLEAGVEVARVHHSYPREAADGGLRLRLGDLYASEPKLLLLELGVELDGEGADETPLAALVLTGDVLTDEGGIERRTVSLPIGFNPAEGPVVHPEVTRTLVLLQAAQARREALEDESRGAHDDGAWKLREASRRLREAGDDDVFQEEARDLSLMADLMEGRRFYAMERKYASQRAYNIRRAKPLSASAAIARGRRSGE